jgi:hypothetical protein
MRHALIPIMLFLSSIACQQFLVILHIPLFPTSRQSEPPVPPVPIVPIPPATTPLPPSHLLYHHTARRHPHLIPHCIHRSSTISMPLCLRPLRQIRGHVMSPWTSIATHSTAVPAILSMPWSLWETIRNTSPPRMLNVVQRSSPHTSIAARAAAMKTHVHLVSITPAAPPLPQSRLLHHHITMVRQQLKATPPPCCNIAIVDFRRRHPHLDPPCCTTTYHRFASSSFPPALPRQTQSPLPPCITASHHQVPHTPSRQRRPHHARPRPPLSHLPPQGIPSLSCHLPPFQWPCTPLSSGPAQRARPTTPISG